MARLIACLHTALTLVEPCKPVSQPASVTKLCERDRQEQLVGAKSAILFPQKTKRKLRRLIHVGPAIR